jgi:hypothetical protein
MQQQVHSRTAILAAMLEALEGCGGPSDRAEVAAFIRRQILGDADPSDSELDALITKLIRRALVAEWIRPDAESQALQISAEGHHVLKLHRQGKGVLSQLIRRPRALFLGNRGPA